jgi:F0F1-type ATP synthase assembly protein I
MESAAMQGNKGVYQAIGLVGQFGFLILVPVVLCFAAGLYLDKWLGTNFLVIIFFFIGALTGTRNIFVLVKKLYSNDTKDESD